MPTTSESNQQRNWSELPSDLWLNILQKVGVVDVLKNAQRVCTAWREICKDPAFWRVIYVDRYSGRNVLLTEKLLVHAVNKSQGQLVDLTMVGFNTYGFLYDTAADRLKQLRRLKMGSFLVEEHKDWSDWSFVVKRTPLLEELSFVRTYVSSRQIAIVSGSCPLLKTLIVKHDAHRLWYGICNEIANAIGKYLPELAHLELIGNPMNNDGLEAILDGCCHLESLDLRLCFNLDLTGDLGKRCSQQIKRLKLPNDPLHGWCP